MKIVQVVALMNCGKFVESQEWKLARKKLHSAVKRVAWPPGEMKFTINGEPGERRGEGNGVKPIKDGLMSQLRETGWTIEARARNPDGRPLGRFDAVYQFSFGACVLEWETGNISSSHRSLNKMAMLVSKGIVAAGILIVPSRELYRFLTDRVGNIQELAPYFDLGNRSHALPAF